jgi:peptide chain release factor 1
VEGEDPLKFFKKEIGSHRIQRVPPTESNGRVHTSIVNVLVLEKKETKQININPSEVIITYYKDSGAGGQHKNRTFSCVRLQYKGIKIECGDTRNQGKNKQIAFDRLKEKIKQKQIEEDNIKNNIIIESQNYNKGNRGDFERNYNFPRDEIKQGGNKFSLSRFMRGDLSQIYKVGSR